MDHSEPDIAPASSVRERRRPSAQLAKLDDWCEKGIFGLILGILVYSPLALGSVLAQSFVVIEWVTVIVLALWLCRFWLNPKHRLLWPPVCWGVLAFMAYAMGRYYTADVEYLARQEMIKVLVYGCLFLVMIHNLYHLERLQVAGMVLLGVGTVLAMYGVAQFLTGSDYVWNIVRPQMFHKRGSGTFINPDHLAGYLEMLLPLALAFTLTGRLDAVKKVLIGYAALAIFAGIFVSVSVGGWIATGVALVVLFLWLMRIRDYRLQGILLMVTMVVIAGVFILRAELSPNRMDHLSTVLKGENVRLTLWKAGTQMWQDNLWFGMGPGHFDTRFPAYRQLPPKNPSGMQVRPEYVHNDYLNTLVDYGLVGAVLVALVFGLFYWNVFSSWKYVQRAQSDLAAKRSNKGSFVMGGSLGLLAILVHSLFDFNMHIPSNAILAVTLLALVSAHFRYATERYWHTVHAPLRIVVTVLLVCGIAYLGQQSWRLTQEAQQLGKAEISRATLAAQAEAYQAALAAEPKNPKTAYALGESYRLQAWDGGENYQELTRKAMQAFTRATELNPYDSMSYLRYGMCMDFLKDYSNSVPYYEKALKLDPNSYYPAAMIGWHYVQMEDWVKAKEWFEKSRFFHWNNGLAANYLRIINERLAELKGS